MVIAIRDEITVGGSVASHLYRVSRCLVVNIQEVCWKKKAIRAIISRVQLGENGLVRLFRELFSCGVLL